MSATTTTEQPSAKPEMTASALFRSLSLLRNLPACLLNASAPATSPAHPASTTSPSSPKPEKEGMIHRASEKYLDGAAEEAGKQTVSGVANNVNMPQSMDDAEQQMKVHSFLHEKSSSV